MDSTTMRRLTGEQLGAMVRTTMGTELVRATELTGGTFNAVYRIETADRSAVLKASPPAGVPLLTYERDLLRTETRFFDLAGAVEGVKVPAVLARDFDRRLIDGDYAFLSDIPGRSLRDVRTDLPDEPRLRRDLGAMASRIHRVKGTFFGYEHAAQGDTWREAFLAMVDDLRRDAARFGVPIEDVQPVLDANAHLLDAVEEPSLVHFDLWDGNILVDHGELTGLIDGERALWGDPVAEFVSLNMFTWFEHGPDVLAGYENERGQPPGPRRNPPTRPVQDLPGPDRPDRSNPARLRPAGTGPPGAGGHRRPARGHKATADVRFTVRDLLGQGEVGETEDVPRAAVGETCGVRARWTRP